MDGQPEPNDGELLAAAREGDRAAFGELVDRHKELLVNYLTRMTGRREEAEDLAQESFLRLATRSGSYRERGHLTAYLLRIATNLVRGRERQRRRRQLLRSAFLSSNGHHQNPGQESRLLERELQRQVATAIARLPLRFRVPLVLHELEGWSYQQIGELVGCRVGTVKSRVFRGRQRLKRDLEPYWQGAAER